MATTGSNFVQLTVAQLVGTTVQAANSVQPFNPDNATEIVRGGNGVLLDKLSNLGKAGFAKNAGLLLTLTSTTAITIDMTNIATATGVVVAGDTSFAKWNSIELNNLGSVDLTLSPGASNGNAMLLGGTTPTLTIPAGSSIPLASAAGITVDGTHKTFTITPTSGGSLGITIGGS